MLAVARWPTGSCRGLFRCGDGVRELWFLPYGSPVRRTAGDLIGLVTIASAARSIGRGRYCFVCGRLAVLCIVWAAVLLVAVCVSALDDRSVFARTCLLGALLFTLGASFCPCAVGCLRCFSLDVSGLKVRRYCSWAH